MRRTVKRALSRLLAGVLLVSSVFSGAAGPAQAVDYEGSESYMAGKYYEALKQVKLTGDPRTDIVNVALSQVGYLEGTYFDELSGEICGNLNATEYGEWYNQQDQWCAIFVSWCAGVAGVPENVVIKHAYTPTGLLWYRNEGRAYTRARVEAGVYTPKAGDLIYFKSASTRNPTNHVGIVTGYRDGVVYTVEGNTSSPSVFSSGGTVARKSYAITNTYIVYICSPDYELSGLRLDKDTTEEEKLDQLIDAISILETGAEDRYDRIGRSYDGCVMLGCGQWYANDARQLLRRIQKADPEEFARLDTAGIAEDLQQDWKTYRLDPDSEKGPCIRNLLASETGVREQRSLMEETLLSYQAEVAAAGVSEPDAQLICAAVRYMGGTEGLRRVLSRVGSECSVEALCTAMAELGYVGSALICDALS